jgi:CheY-like chemotaxis protein
LAHIFEPFFTTKDVGEGTGLGLATVYGAVKQNNGFINVYSEPGQGQPLPSTSPGISRRPQKRRQQHLLNLLSMEMKSSCWWRMSRQVLQMSKTMLERLGYTVLAAGTPSEAIRLADGYSGQIHLLATDVIMPEMNGRELSARLMESRPEMKCLYMSGYTANIIANQGVLKEGVSFLQKPFSKNELAAKVREAMES